MSQTFASATTTYTASVANSVTRATITPTVNDANASVEYLDGNDAALTDADANKTGFQADLGVGDTVIKVKVTAEDDSTTETYEVTVTRACADPQAIWCATLTVARLEISGVHIGDGYDSSGGMLSGTAFDHVGTTYAVSALYVTGGELQFVLNPTGLTVFNKPAFRLHLGDDEFSLGDATRL